MLDRVEELFKVDVYHDAPASQPASRPSVRHKRLHLPNCLMAGLKPKPDFENVGSKISVNTWVIAYWTTRSLHVGVSKPTQVAAGLWVCHASPPDGVALVRSARAAPGHARPMFTRMGGKFSIITPSMPVTPGVAAQRAVRLDGDCWCSSHALGDSP